MSNFIEEFKKRSNRKNKGLPFGESFSALEKDLLGVQRGKMFTKVAGGEKTGKPLLQITFLLFNHIYML